MSSPVQIHASCVAFGEKAVLLTGNSGMGKSDVALRLIREGAELVADDQVILRKSEHRLLADVPDKLAALMEVRGVGIVKFPFSRNVPIALVVQLVQSVAVERMPVFTEYHCLGVSVPMYYLCGWEASTPLKIKLLLEIMGSDRVRV